MKSKIIQFLLAVVVLGLIYFVYVLISTPLLFEQEQAERESAVIERIKDIRTAERHYKSKYQRFTADFDTLINFILTDSIEYESKIADENDSVAMAKAKEAWKNDKKNRGKKFQNVQKKYNRVKEYAFKHLTEEKIKELRYVPYTNNQTEYILEADMLTTESKVVIPVVRCRTPYIAFLDTVRYRQEVINLVSNVKENFNKYPGIEFGSMERGNNEAGNWE